MHSRLIFLIGLMGSGKTTLARALAQRYGCRFTDLDSVIEQRAGMSVAHIFASQGEEAFRRLEDEALDCVIAMAARHHTGCHTIVATGGGTPCRPGAMEKMNAAGLTVLLEASTTRLATRLADDSASRPLIAGKDLAGIAAVIDSQRVARAPFYNLAATRFNAEHLDSASQIDDSCRLFAQKYLTSNDQK